MYAIRRESLPIYPGLSNRGPFANFATTALILDPALQKYYGNSLLDFVPTHALDNLFAIGRTFVVKKNE